MKYDKHPWTKTKEKNKDDKNLKITDTMEILSDDIIGYSVNMRFYGVSEFLLHVDFSVIYGHFSTVQRSPPSISGISKIRLHHATQEDAVYCVMEPDFWFTWNWRRRSVYKHKLFRLREHTVRTTCQTNIVCTPWV